MIIKVLKAEMVFRCFLYCVSSAHTDQHGTKKLGLTIHPVHRMHVYNTGDAPHTGTEKRYDGLWEVNAESRVHLAKLEGLMHNHFSYVRRTRPNGKYSEWFDVSFDEVAKFLSKQTYVIRQLSIEEIVIIQEKSEQDTSNEDMNDSIVEQNLMSEQKAHIDRHDLCLKLKKDFFATFLPNLVPRRIQSELWDLWSQICIHEPKYRGIVQWTTGTGKTIAMLLLFVLSANACKQKGTIFRGLLIAPKNDIFDTIIHHIRKLSTWGIVVCEGHNARLSSLHIPLDKPILVTVTHASLTELNSWDKLPAMNHVHYDEVHRITGDEFHILIQSKLEQWNTSFLTGTSATPKTCSQSQHKKISELFGNPLKILHKCDVDEAILEGWIAQPRFGVNIMSNDVSRKMIVKSFVNAVRLAIIDKRDKGLWSGGKIIAYLSLRSDVCEAVTMAKEVMPDWHIYTAVEDADASGDDKFVSDDADGTPRILFACERYREGSDIKGLEMTAILMGNTIGANILLQIAGRALRNDYIGKEGWCVIVRPSDEGTTEDDVFDSIVLQIMEFIGKDDATAPTKEKIKRLVDKFFGPVAISGKVYNIDETILRIQSMYARKAFERSDPKEKYEVIRALNRDMGLSSKEEYETRASEHSKYIDDPKVYFKDWWVSWYHFLGVDTSAFPQTKEEWSNICKQLGLTSWDQYKQKKSQHLPPNPGLMYEDYTNPIKEFDIEEQHIW